ncbi:MAG: ABC transporter substrate-binding protein [Granulosicoccus sp.]|nr:ABC transporter substrate-binding protein [Granulosicoccus sp.]
MKALIIKLTLPLLLLVAPLLHAAEPVKVGLLKFGTVNWEIKAMKAAGLDIANNVEVTVVPFASGDASEIAIQGGEVDIIVSDWLWVSRMRANGADLTFAPYSSSVGSIMVADDSPVKTLGDLKGKKLGVAGGPLDKSWLLLQGMAKQEFGLDLAAENEIVFAAPPLLAEKTRDGELDAMLNFWHYCARLKAAGFRYLVSAEDAANALGASGPVSAIGYVFSEEWATKNPVAAKGFIEASKATKQLLKESDAEWVRLGETKAIKDKEAARNVLRDKFRQGIPSRPVQDEIVDAGVLYEVLAGIGGKKLVGDSPVMVEGTYWKSLIE